jgi:hypothetical protein
VTIAAAPSLRSALRAPLREGALRQAIRHHHRSTSTDAEWGHFRPSHRGQCKPSLSPFVGGVFEFEQAVVEIAPPEGEELAET